MHEMRGVFDDCLCANMVENVLSNMDMWHDAKDMDILLQDRRDLQDRPQYSPKEADIIIALSCSAPIFRRMKSMNGRLKTIVAGGAFAGSFMLIRRQSFRQDISPLIVGLDILHTTCPKTITQQHFFWDNYFGLWKT